MHSKKTNIRLAVFTALGVLGAVSVASARDDIDTRGDRGGSVVPCSLSGVNPAHHREIFGNPAVAAREYGFIRARDGSWYVEPNCHR
jgi:hypothetical protein